MLAVPPHYWQPAADERMTGVRNDDMPKIVWLIFQRPCVSLVSLRLG
jgi:hypothetical protein